MLDPQVWRPGQRTTQGSPEPWPWLSMPRESLRTVRTSMILLCSEAGPWSAAMRTICGANVLGLGCWPLVVWMKVRRETRMHESNIFIFADREDTELSVIGDACGGRRGFCG